METKRKTREYFENITKDELRNENLLTFLRAHSAELRGAKLGWFLNVAEQYTIGEFCKLTKQQVKKFRNIGNFSVILIERALKKYGLHLSQSEEQPQKETNVVESTKNLIIDWEQRRYEIAKELMPHFLSLWLPDKNGKWEVRHNKEIAAKESVSYADALIEQLRKATNND